MRRLADRCLVGSITIALTTSSTLAQPRPAPPPPPPIITSPVLRPPIMTPADKAKFDKRVRAANACRRAFLGQSYYPHPAVWRISDSDTTIHLLGTVHQLPTGFEWRNAQLDEIIAQSGSLVTESGALSKGETTELKARFFQPRPGSSLPPLVDRLEGERRAKWIGMASVLPDTTVQSIERMPSWLAAIGISSAADRSGKALGMTRGVDDQLKAEFTKAKKQVGAMEDPKEVFAAVNAIPQSVQLQMLQSAMDEVGRRWPLERRMLSYHRWAQGGAPLTDEQLALFPDEIRQQLLDVRNAAWVGEVRKMLRSPGTTLIAVGAAHLHGKNSLIDLLAKEGIRADRISAKTATRARPEFKPTPKSLQECQTYLFGKAVPQAGVE